MTRGHWEDRYDVDVMTCAACAALQRTSRKVHERKPNSTPSAGLYFGVHEEVG